MTIKTMSHLEVFPACYIDLKEKSGLYDSSFVNIEGHQAETEDSCKTTVVNRLHLIVLV